MPHPATIEPVVKTETPPAAPAVVEQPAVGDVPMDETTNIEGFIEQFVDPPSAEVIPPAQPPETDPPKDPVAPKEPVTPPSTEVEPPAETGDVDKTIEDPSIEPAKAEVTKGKAKPSKANTDARRIAGLEKWNHQLSQKMSEQSKMLADFIAKQEGTYVEPVAPDPKDVAETATMDAYEAVSRERANTEFTKEFVDETVYVKDSPYRMLIQEAPWIARRVSASKQPTHEAILAVAQNEFFEQYGHDPETIKKTIADEAREAVMAELKAVNTKPTVGKPPPSTTGIRTQTVPAGAKPEDQGFSLDEINPGLSDVHDAVL